MHNTHEGYLTLPNLPSKACKTYLFNDMQSSLISIGQVCIAGYVATFSKEHALINKKGELILKGQLKQPARMSHHRPTRGHVSNRR